MDDKWSNVHPRYAEYISLLKREEYLKLNIESACSRIAELALQNNELKLENKSVIETLCEINQEMYHLNLEIDCSMYTSAGKYKNKFPPSLNARLHWAQRSKLNKLWRARMYIAIGKSRPLKPLLKVHVIITRSSTREVDFDNMVTSCKPIIDGIVDAGIVVNDAPSHFSADFKFEKCKRNEEKLILHITEVA